MHHRVAGSIPGQVRAHTWVVVLIPGEVIYGRQQIDVSLSLSLILPFSLKINKHNFRQGLKTNKQTNSLYSIHSLVSCFIHKIFCYNKYTSATSPLMTALYDWFINIYIISPLFLDI